ncbi:ABC transporter [Vairimorpha necatrix]|uniref:ABC transporter n=1 Tax=Vairimorpha necatrix TaxID=6039 RepID=A0AAX4JEV5_9MICR
METNKNILKYENLIYEVKNKDKKIHTKYATIINGLSASIESGKLTAVMGASGCGKTHLFELLIGNLPADCKTSGKITYNEQEKDEKNWVKQIAFLPQDDIYYPDLTTYESIMYNLSFNSNTYKENVKIANEAIESACISNKKDAPIKTLSGGERKRAMIAITMANNPEILILDEPTTGLDSHSALKIVESLKKYAVYNNKIVIMTVHQPGDGMFSLFDDLLFLTRGGMFYSGPANEINRFLESNNIIPPSNMSHSEVLFILHSDPEESEFARKHESVVKDIVYRNAVKNQLPEPKVCNNKKMFFFDLNFRHALILVKHNFKLMLKSPDRLKNFILFFLLSLPTYGLTFLRIWLKSRKELKTIYEMLGKTGQFDFSEKFALSYALFTSEFALSVAFWTTFFSINMQDEVILKMELFTRQYSAMTYYLYNFLQKFLCSYIFLSISFLLLFIIDFNIGYSKEILCLSFPIIVISLFFTVASNLLLTSIPLGKKISYFFVLSNSCGIYYAHSIIIDWYRKKMCGLWDKLPYLLDLLLIFPNYCFDIYSMTRMRITMRNSKSKDFQNKIEVIKPYEKFLMEGSMIKETYAEDTPIIRTRNYENYYIFEMPVELKKDPKFALSLISFDITPNILLYFIIPLSLSVCVMLTLFMIKLKKVPNIRTKLMN